MSAEDRPPTAGRRPRLGDVATAAGVSDATASLALRGRPGPSDTTRRRVLEAAERLGYRPDRAASLLARRRAHLLGVLLDVRNTFHAELADALQAAAYAVGYDVVLSAVGARHDERRAAETLVDHRCEALLLLGPDAPQPWLRALGAERPVVAVGRRVDAPEIDVVRSADDLGIGLAVGHLVDLGHRAIAFLDAGAGTIATDRRRGYRQAMRRHGLTAEERLVPAGYTEEDGVRAAATLLAADGGRTRASAAVAVNDRCAVGLLDGLARARVAVPRAMSVVGYDDSPLARLPQVALTTVSQHTEDLARAAVQVAVERLDGGRPARREVVLDPHLVVRATTAAVSARRRLSAGG